VAISVNNVERLFMITTSMAAENEDPVLQQSELTDAIKSVSLEIEQKREALIKSVKACELNTVETKVAWVLNNFPNTRDSDLALQIRFWQHFQSEHFDGSAITVRDYYRLAKLTTLTRARATIQNTLKLFQASDEVKKVRKQLQKGEHDNALKKRASHHHSAIYLDESGKTQDHLVVGSIWFLNGAETLKIHRLLTEWKARTGFGSEFHFQAITESKLPAYIQAADILVSNSATVSFKVISVPRRGISDVHDALLQLSFHLLLRGLEHEHRSNRAPLPRGISVCKDAEEPGQDKLFAAELAARMKQAAATQFEGNLSVEDFSAEESSTSLLLQLTDLFTSSVSRQLNATGDRRQAKDRFADYFLGKLGIAVQDQPSEALGDLAVHIVL
jgi:hypothetical protein